MTGRAGEMSGRWDGNRPGGQQLARHVLATAAIGVLAALVLNPQATVETAPTASATSGPTFLSAQVSPTPTPNPEPQTGVPAPPATTAAGTSAWASLNNSRPVFPRCSTVNWSYDASLAPSTSTEEKVLGDIRGALVRLSAETGLRFVETTDASPYTVIFSWDYHNDPGASAFSGFTRTADKATGRVGLNPGNWWTADDRYSGFGLVQSGNRTTAGRGWLFVHEVMHVLGFGHVDSPDEIMNPVSSTLTRLGPSDLAGLHAVYRPEAC